MSFLTPVYQWYFCNTYTEGDGYILSRDFRCKASDSYDFGTRE